MFGRKSRRIIKMREKYEDREVEYIYESDTPNFADFKYEAAHYLPDWDADDHGHTTKEKEWPN